MSHQAQSMLYFAVSFLFCFFGWYILFGGTAQGLRIWRAGQRWREQVTGVVTFRGMFADEWGEEVNGKRLVRIEQTNGSSKMLLVGKAFYELLPEIGEDVEIDYLFGCEAVVAVRPLAGAAGTAPAEDQPAEG